MFELVGLGGTFDHFHEGHALLIKTALKVSEKVMIGLSTEKLLKDKEYKENLESYDVRKNHLVQFLKRHSALEQAEVCELNDPFGPPAREPDYEGLVVSQETYEGGLKINELRQEKGLEPLVLIVIPILTDQADNKISSTDIRKSTTNKE
ncbi:MAG: pantetheine-phosphate adenylyltransferase [Promethearchaeia archaeon]